MGRVRVPQAWPVLGAFILGVIVSFHVLGVSNEVAGTSLNKHSPSNWPL